MIWLNECLLPRSFQNVPNPSHHSISLHPSHPSSLYLSLLVDNWDDCIWNDYYSNFYELYYRRDGTKSDRRDPSRVCNHIHCSSQCALMCRWNITTGRSTFTREPLRHNDNPYRDKDRNTHIDVYQSIVVSVYVCLCVCECFLNHRHVPLKVLRILFTRLVCMLKEKDPTYIQSPSHGLHDPDETGTPTWTHQTDSTSRIQHPTTG